MSGSTTRRQWSLSLLLAVAWVMFAWLALRPAYFPPSVTPILELTITKNRVPITNLRQRRDVELRQTVRVDVLDLANGDRFAHPQLGALGYGEHFFVDIESRVDVLRAGRYRFVLGSDDGFALYVDEVELCAHLSPRAFATQDCMAELSAGQRRVRIRYFQAAGHAGLSLRYALDGDPQLFWFGERSPHLLFTPL